MKTLLYPTDQVLKIAFTRPSLDTKNLNDLVNEIFENVKKKGDEAIYDYTSQFDKCTLNTLQVTDDEIAEAIDLLDPKLKQAINTAAENIAYFHSSQKEVTKEIETFPGVTCWRKSVPIEKIGCYIPGGTAPLFSTVLMLGIPAKVAQTPIKIMCTPANKDGKIHPAILYAASLVGFNQIFKIGGAQAIAALAIGTESIPKVDKIFGPGNQYVTSAKQHAQQLGVAIDMPAGPSEVLVASDNTIPPAITAADLLAQAEHGIDSQVILLTDSENYVSAIKIEIENQLTNLPRKDICIQALKNGYAIVADSSNWSEIINSYAPEHLILMGKHETYVLPKIKNAGSVFLGEYTAESFGDYASGTNHTLPTAGYARAYSGVSLDSYMKKITFQKVARNALFSLGEIVVTMAKAEGLEAHAQAILQRQISSSDLNEVKQQHVSDLIRPDLRNMESYASARDDFKEKNGVFLDANENSLIELDEKNPNVRIINRYPDPLQIELKQTIGELKNIPVENLFLGNGSDEVLDLIFRLVGIPFLDKVAFLNPSYGMYRVLANLNSLEIQEINLNEHFELDVDSIISQATNSKILVLCNPNNPTGKLIPKKELIHICKNFKGLVVIDEAYIDFCLEESMVNELPNFQNLIITQTLSKMYGMAGLRVGIAICNPHWVDFLNKIKPPYNISSYVQNKAIELLTNTKWPAVLSNLIVQREKLYRFLISHKKVLKVYKSEANFILFKVKNGNEIYQKLCHHSIVIRNRNTQFACENHLRISVGNEKENEQFIQCFNLITDIN